MVPMSSKTPSLAVLAAILILGGCGGRASGILGRESGSNEGGSSGNVTSGTPEGSTVEMQPHGSVTDSPSGTGAEGSSGNPTTASDGGADATGAGIGSVDATGGLEASSLIDAAHASESEADVMVPCGPPAAGTLFVDPNAGHDDDGGTGSQSCPFKSLTHALSLVGDAGAPVTVEIVNTSAEPTLSQSTGEVFPIAVPGGVTITAEDTTKNTPTVEVSVTPNVAVADPCLSGKIAGFCLSEPNARLSHLIVVVPSVTGGAYDYGVIIVSPGTVTVDHVTIEDFTEGDGIYLPGSVAGSNVKPTIGPGVLVRGSTYAGLHVYNGTATIVGGAGAEHTSFTANSYGIWVEVWGAVNIQGAPIDAANPDLSDIDVDDNFNNGLYLNTAFGGASPPPSRISGLHVAGNGTNNPSAGVGIQGLGPFMMRGSYIGINGGRGVNVYEYHYIDLGNPVGPDYGRNIFAGNPDGDICNESGANEPPVAAGGNIFGTIDCAIGGKLNPAVLGPANDCGDTTSVNVANCTF